MRQITPVLEKYFPWLLVAAVAWVLLFLSLRAFARRRRGEPVFRPDIPGTVFLETWASGGRSALAWARNCVWVAVTQDALHIGMHFPFNLAIPRSWSRFFAHDLTIPLSSIVGTEKPDGFMEGSSLEVKFREGNGHPAKVDLELRREDVFVRCLVGNGVAQETARASETT